MVQTKKVLAKSLKEMLQTKPLEKVTIKQLVEKCNINRQTFYYHFHDIYELVEYMFLVELDKIFENPMDLEGINTSNRWATVYYTILYSLLQNKKIIMSIFNSIGKERLESISENIFYHIIMLLVDEDLEKSSADEEEKIFIVNFYKYAFSGITLDWVKNLMKVDPEVIVKRVNNLIGGNPKI